MLGSHTPTGRPRATGIATLLVFVSVGAGIGTGTAHGQQTLPTVPSGTVAVAPAVPSPGKTNAPVSMPGPIAVTAQVVDSDKLANVVAAPTVQGSGAQLPIAGTPPPTNSPGVVVTPVEPSAPEPTVSTAPAGASNIPATVATKPTSKAKPKKKTTKPRAVPVAAVPTDSKPEPKPTDSVAATGSSPTDTKVAAKTGISASMEANLAALRKCESGGNYKINTGNGYYGAYQFALGTWRRLGYSGYPHEAAPATQDEAAVKLQAKAGWGQWPACSRKLGLR
jgi:hypothetical protein